MSATSISSGLISAAATTVIVARKSRLNALAVISDGTNLATVVVYDNASAASGTVLAKGVATSSCPTVSLVFENPVRAEFGITISVVGTGSGAVVHYDA